MNFDKIYTYFKVYVTERHKKQSSDTIKYDFENHILPYFKCYDINKITKLDIINWQNEILKQNYSNNFNFKLFYTFSLFMNYCVSCSYIERNILKDVSSFPKKIEIKTHNVYTLKQFRKFRRFLDNFIIKHFFNFMYFYGTRPSEAMALRFTDIKGCYIRIIHSIERHGKRTISTPKNQSSIRVFKISLLMLFRIYLLKKYYIKKYGVFDSNYFIFGGLKPLAPTTIDRYKKKAYIRAKLPKITQHEFRHSYATRMIHSKKPIDFVSRSMGHSRVSTTLDVYLHQEKNVLNTFLTEN